MASRCSWHRCGLLTLLLCVVWAVTSIPAVTSVTPCTERRFSDTAQLKNATWCEEAPVNTNYTAHDAAIIDQRIIQFDVYGRPVSGHVVWLKNPLKHFSAVPPPQGCGGGFSTVSNTSAHFEVVKHFQRPARLVQPPWKRKPSDPDSVTVTSRVNGCRIAVNAGFFNTTSSACYGNIVYDGKHIHESSRRNAHFGIRDGRFVVGYVSLEEVMDKSRPFDQLIGGVVMLVRNGVPWVWESTNFVEDLSTQETGTRFTSINSGRTSVGHDRDGNLVILQIDGQSWVSGIDLYTLSTQLIELGVVNAINIDGGGSTTMVKDTTLINSATYQECGWPRPEEGDALFRCERHVTSILCLHDQPEEPPQAPPLPECAPLPNHTQHACGRCGPVFAQPCADSSTVFGDAAAPAAGIAQDGNRVETQFLTLCEQCCGCSEWNGGAYLVEDPNVRRLGVFQTVITWVSVTLVMAVLVIIGMCMYYDRRRRLLNHARHVKLRDIDDLLSGGYDEHGELSGLTDANGAQRSPSPGMLRFGEAAAGGSPLGAQGAGAGVAMNGGAGAAGEGSSGGPRSAQDTVVAAGVELTERRSSGTPAAVAGGVAASDVGDGKVPASATPGGGSRVARPHSHSYESSDGGHDETTPLAKV